MLVKTALLPVVLAIAPLTPLRAQTAAAAPAPHVLIETVGPDGWRLRFGPTNLGSLLESESGRKLWEPRVLPVLGMWQQMIGDDALYAAARTRLLGYGGRIRLGLWFDLENRELDHAALLIDGDGRTDLGALAKDLRDLQTRTIPGEWAELDVAGTKIATCSEGADTVTAPVREGEHLLLAHARGNKLADAMGRARSLAADATGKPPAPNTPAMQVTVDVAAVLAMEHWFDAEGKEPMRALGLDSLGRATMTLGTAGPHVQFELAQEFTRDERGLFAALCPASQGLGTLARLAVPGTSSWKAGRLDFAALWSAIEAARVASGEGTRDELRAETKKELGLDVADDLLAHATDEALLVTSPLQDLDEVGEVTWSLAVLLRDEGAFGKASRRCSPRRNRSSRARTASSTARSSCAATATCSATTSGSRSATVCA